MKLPTRIQQHKAESESYAILLYKLRHVGIFRNMTQSDYGIDFEVELVLGDQVTGRYLKAQVKSSKNLKVRKKDGVPVVGGIKESTLLYWAELSYRTHVILYAVDLKTEQIYVSRPVFWQAISLINGDGKTKSIEFLPELAKGESEEIRARMPELYTLAMAVIPSLPDIIYSHKASLRYLKLFLNLYVDVFHCDGHMEVRDQDVLKTFLDTCQTLLAAKNFDSSSLSKADHENLYSFDYWVRKEKEWGFDSGEVLNYSAQIPVRVLMPALIEKLSELRSRVFKGKYYWKFKDRPYLQLVYETSLPSDTSHEMLMEWGYNVERIQNQTLDFYLFEIMSSVELKEAGIDI
ncbi:MULTISPECIES: DUF4365 domain-containing protein [unclassified Pseudomonas]|uniref:DUF4365 domain-containing protein n=1 Tax=unclassified Pseudomonas TaxID=196821 RepID=UPI001B32B816|nr:MULTISPECIES: DUF4365 domain-containing protein [unclassified Pseudomonas]